MTTERTTTPLTQRATLRRGSTPILPVMPLAKEMRENLSTHVERHVRLALLAGHFSPGDRISLISLAEALGTSVTPVREAVSRLAAAQALEVSPGQFARVPAFDEKRYEELRDIRVAVECLAAERAAQRVTKRELVKIKRALNAFITASSNQEVEKMLLASRDFRFLIYKTSNMPTLVRVIEDLWLRSAPSFRLMYATQTSDRDFEALYSDLFEAISNHDPVRAREIVQYAVTIGAQRLIEMVGS